MLSNLYGKYCIEKKKKETKFHGNITEKQQISGS